MPDKVAVMKDGRLLQIGSPLEIYRKPINIFVAEFFGTPSINMVLGEFDDRRGEPRFISKSINLTLEDYAWAESLENYFGRQVIIGIRPENVQIRSAGVTDADGTGTVISTVNLGDRNLVQVDIGQDKPLVAFAPHSVQPNAGSTISFNVDKSGLIFFDPSNERRIAPT
jgi:ABC-type sugar transport system ATPase subunit